MLVEKPFLDGVLNITFFDIQVYWFLMLVGIIFLIGLEVVMQYFYWKPMERVQGAYHSIREGTNAVFIANMKLNFELISEAKAKVISPLSDYYDEVFRERGPLMYFAAMFGWKVLHRNYDMAVVREYEKEVKEAPVAFLGATAADIIIDIDNWSVLGSKSHAECARVQNAWNLANPYDPILTYAKLYRYILEKKIGDYDPELLRVSVPVPWVRINAQYSGNHKSWDGYVRQLESDLKTEDTAKYSKWFFPILGFGFLLCLVILGFGALNLL